MKNRPTRRDGAVGFVYSAMKGSSTLPMKPDILQKETPTYPRRFRRKADYTDETEQKQLEAGCITLRQEVEVQE